MARKLSWVLEPIANADPGALVSLRQRATELKRTDGAGWAAGEVLERACEIRADQLKALERKGR
jgi:hypothetical protein